MSTVTCALQVGGIRPTDRPIPAEVQREETAGSYASTFLRKLIGQESVDSSGHPSCASLNVPGEVRFIRGSPHCFHLTASLAAVLVEREDRV
jgi:hypothetical protein